ncbi:hypothetical protein ES703_90848 [subsurface metagenome]
MSLCDYCLIKDGLCPHLKAVMKHTLRNTGIDGSQLCPLILAVAVDKTEALQSKSSTPPGFLKGIISSDSPEGGNRD